LLKSNYATKLNDKLIRMKTNLNCSRGRKKEKYNEYD